MHVIVAMFTIDDHIKKPTSKYTKNHKDIYKLLNKNIIRHVFLFYPKHFAKSTSSVMMSAPIRTVALW